MDFRDTMFQIAFRLWLDVKTLRTPGASRYVKRAAHGGPNVSL